MEAARNDDPARVARDIELNLGPHLPGDLSAPILEVGFGFGEFLDYLAAEGHSEYKGIDVDAESVDRVRPRHPVEKVSSAARALEGDQRRYLAIVLRHVISHLTREDAIELVSAAHGALDDGGTLIIQTFNAALPSAQYTFANDLTHRVSYTEHSLRQLLLLGGFGEVAIMPGRLALRGSRGRVFMVARSLYTRILRAKFTLERGRGGNPTIYTKELVAVARKVS